MNYAQHLRSRPTYALRGSGHAQPVGPSAAEQLRRSISGGERRQTATVAQAAASAPVAGINTIDARSPKPLLRGWMHLLWFELSLVAGTALLLQVGAGDRAVASVYVVAVCALFGTSALYHRGDWSPRAMTWFARTDHVMIFVLIAGSATPLFLAATPGWAGRAMLGSLVGLTITLVVARLVWTTAPESVVGATYVGLGCLGGAALPGVLIRAGVWPFVLILLGGILYIAGAITFHQRRPDPIPAVFGFHEVFHVYVCAGATLQFIAIAVFIV